MIASVGTILIAPGDGDMAVYLEQLGRLAALGASLALPAHGEPVTDPTAVFERYVAHRKMREEKILRCLGATDPDRGATAAELVPSAYDDAPPAIWPVAKISVDAHLEKLEREGRIVRTGRADAFRVVR
jgi:glyoxylase-like metal-dependent hydrolase (beta-lactamase superfamily II)